MSPRIPPFALITCSALMAACANHPAKIVTAPDAPVHPAEESVAAEPLARVPMGTDFGLPFIEVTFTDGRTGTFILDTGFPVNVIDADVAEAAGLTIGEADAVLQPGGEVQMAPIPAFTLTIGGLTVAPMSAQTAPLAGLGMYVGRPLDGILGHPFIERYVLELDYQGGEMRIHAPNAEVADAGATAIPIRVVDGEVLVPFTLVQAGHSFIDEIKLDTGSVDNVGFALNFYEDANLEVNAPNFQSVNGVGGGGETEARRFAIDELRFGDRTYRNVVAGAVLAAAGTERRTHAGTNGAGILAAQDLVLDYPHLRIFLGTPYASTMGMQADGAGLQLILTEAGFVVLQVIQGTPAHHAGLEAGDVLISIDGEVLAGRSLDSVARLFQASNGTRHLEGQRGEDAFEADVALAPLF